MSGAPSLPRTTFNIGGKHLLIGVDISSLEHTNLRNQALCYSENFTSIEPDDWADLEEWLERTLRRVRALKEADDIIGGTIAHAARQTVANADELWSSALQGSQKSQRALNGAFAEALRVQVASDGSRDPGTPSIRGVPLVISTCPPSWYKSPYRQYDVVRFEEDPTVKIELQSSPGLSMSRVISRITCDVCGVFRSAGMTDDHVASDTDTVFANDRFLERWTEDLEQHVPLRRIVASYLARDLSKPSAEEELSGCLGAYTRQQVQLWADDKLVQDSRPDTKIATTLLPTGTLGDSVPLTVSLSYPFICETNGPVGSSATSGS